MANDYTAMGKINRSNSYYWLFNSSVSLLYSKTSIFRVVRCDSRTAVISLRCELPLHFYFSQSPVNTNW